MSEQRQRQAYFGLSHEEDQAMWQAIREGRAAEALNLIITTHVAREHHAGLIERAEAWDEGFAARAQYEARRDVPIDWPDLNPYRETATPSEDDA